jgi:hypothetical protein
MMIGGSWWNFPQRTIASFSVRLLANLVDLRVAAVLGTVPHIEQRTHRAPADVRDQKRPPIDYAQELVGVLWIERLEGFSLPGNTS